MQQVTQAVDQLLKKHFFKPSAAQSLSLFRFLYCLFLLWKLWNERLNQVAKFSGTTWYPIPLFELFHVPLMSAETFQLLQYVLFVALVLTGLGVFTRVSAAVACVAFFLYMGTYLGFGKSPHTNYVIHSHNIVVFVLFILSIAPGVGCYGFDGWRQRGWRWSIGGPGPALLSAWPIQLLKLTLGLAYFGAGYCKLAAHPLWADGYNLQAYLMAKHLLVDCEPGAWIAQSYWLCLFLSIATLVLELSFFIIVFFPRLTWFYVFGALSFHYAIYLTMKINFFPYYGCTFLIFVDWPTLTFLAAPLVWLANRLRAAIWRESESFRNQGVASPVLAAPLPATLGDTRFARFAILGLWGLLAVCIYARIESWPFTDYRVFTGRNKISDVRIFRLAVADERGQWQWAPPRWVPLSPTSINRRVQAHLQHDDQESLSHMLAEMASHVAKRDASQQYQAVVFVERTLRVDPDTQELRVIDRPLQQAPLPGAAGADAPIEIAGREGDTLLR